MKNIRINTFIGLLIGFVWTTSVNAQVAQQKVGGNPMTINQNAALEIESADRGLLLPRLALTSTDSFTPLTAHVAGMTVYNTAMAGTDDKAVTPGYYYNDGTQWVRIAVATDIKTEPWFVQGGSNQATLNTQNIYQTGKVSIGGSNGTGTLTVLNASGTDNAVDVAMRALRPNGAWATLNFVSNLEQGSFSHLSRAGDKGLIFCTDGDGHSYSRNGLLIAPHTASGSSSPFGFKITEQGLSTINAPVPTETFDVNGTFRVRQLPVHGAENAIFTLPNGNTSLADVALIGDIKKTQTFTATRTVVANANGVLGYVDGLPVGDITTDNGLTKTLNNIQLGGPLVKNTLINQADYTFEIATNSKDLKISGLDKTKVQATDATAGITDRLLAVDGNDKVKALKAAMPKFFYMPSVLVPTHDSHVETGQTDVTFDNTSLTGTINLYNIYVAQFGTPVASTNAGALPVLPIAELDFHITYATTEVFVAGSINIDPVTGIMSYEVSSTANFDNGSFMNIVFSVKED